MTRPPSTRTHDDDSDTHLSATLISLFLAVLPQPVEEELSMCIREERSIPKRNPPLFPLPCCFRLLPSLPMMTQYTMSGAVPSHWKGKCVTSADFPATSCNGKIIGARFYLIGFLKQYGSFGSKDFLSPRDGVGHGTWCAS